MKKHILFPVLIALLGATVTSCSSKLYSDPADRITEDQIIEYSKTDPTKTLGPMSQAIEEFPKNNTTGAIDLQNMRIMLLRLDYRGNDMIHLNPNVWLYGDYRMTASYRIQTDPLPTEFWRWFYQYVYKANQLLNVIPDISEVANETVQKQLKIYRACALTLRAWGYTYLMWLYQDDYLHGGDAKAGVPLYLQPNLPAAGRAPSQEVWGRIISDASEAVRLFAEGGRDSKASVSDFDATVANMILARAALTTGDWATVINAMNDVIAVYPTLMNETDYTTKGFGWLNVDEVIYGFADDQTLGGNSSFHGWMNIAGDGGEGGSKGAWNAIGQRLYDKIADDDYRKENFLAAPMTHTYKDAGSPTTWPKYASVKFDAPAHGENNNVRQAEIFIRASEAYLMKAEAEARSGGDPTATLDALLAARTKAGQAPLTCATYPGMADLPPLEKVQLQTRIELWGEGFEFINNKRWGLKVDRQTPASANHAETSLIVQEQRDITLQIPLNTELVYNPNITSADQNP